MLEKTLESPLDCKEIKPVNPKGNQPWIFIGRTDAKALVLWLPEAKSQFIRNDPDAEKDWGQEKGTTGDEMVGCRHQLDGHEFVQTLGVSDGQGGLAWCSTWGCKVLDMIEWLNNNSIYQKIFKVIKDLKTYKRRSRKCTLRRPSSYCSPPNRSINWEMSC